VSRQASYCRRYEREVMEDEGRYCHRQWRRARPSAPSTGVCGAARPRMGKVAIQETLKRAGVEGAQVSVGHLGQILTAGQGQNPARPGFDRCRHRGREPGLGRQPALRSGLRAVALGYQAILNGDSEIVVAGGQESMSQAPHCAHLRSGVKMGQFRDVDTMIKDGLWDAFNGYHMGNTAENVARQWQITRAQQDEFAVGSQNKAEAAQKAGNSRTRSPR